MLAAADQIDAPFAVINADDYYGPTGFRLIHDHLAAACAGPDAPAPWAMVGFLLGEHGERQRLGVPRGLPAGTNTAGWSR